MFAEFHLTEALARVRLDAWAAGIRADWSIGPVTEARRGPDSPSSHWSTDSVAPVQRSQVTGPLRILRRELWARGLAQGGKGGIWRGWGNSPNINTRVCNLWKWTHIPPFPPCEARGEWAHYGEPCRGASSAAIEVAFPVEGQK